MKYKPIKSHWDSRIEEQINTYISKKDNSVTDISNNYTYTQNNFSLVDNYIYSLSNTINVFKNAPKNIILIDDTNVRTEAINILSIIQNVILNNKKQIEQIGYLPPMNMHKDEDGSFSIDWSFKNMKIGFTIEKNKNQSGWFIVTGKEMGWHTDSGLIENTDLNILIPELLSQVINHA